MTKAEIIQNVADATGLGKRDIEAAFNGIFFQMYSSLKRGESIYIRGFGTFNVRERAAKTARNIAKNTTITLPPKAVVKFKPCRELINDVSNLKLTNHE